MNTSDNNMFGPVIQFSFSFYRLFQIWYLWPPYNSYTFMFFFFLNLTADTFIKTVSLSNR